MLSILLGSVSSYLQTFPFQHSRPYLVVTKGNYGRRFSGVSASPLHGKMFSGGKLGEVVPAPSCDPSPNLTEGTFCFRLCLQTLHSFTLSLPN